MTNRMKIKEVLSGRELLRIESLHKQLPKAELRRKIASLSVVYVLGTGYCLWTFWGEFIPLVCLILLASTIYAVMVAVLIVHIGNRGNPLIFTDKGIVLPNIIANCWSEIESYEWEDFKGRNKVPGPSVFSFSEGTCLSINLRGAMSVLCSRWRDNKGGNVLATYLIFFSAEQVVKAEAIISEYDVLRKR